MLLNSLSFPSTWRGSPHNRFKAYLNLPRGAKHYSQSWLRTLPGKLANERKNKWWANSRLPGGRHSTGLTLGVWEGNFRSSTWKIRIGQVPSLKEFGKTEERLLKFFYFTCRRRNTKTCYIVLDTNRLGGGGSFAHLIEWRWIISSVKTSTREGWTSWSTYGNSFSLSLSCFNRMIYPDSTRE